MSIHTRSIVACIANLPSGVHSVRLDMPQGMNEKDSQVIDLAVTQYYQSDDFKSTGDHSSILILCDELVDSSRVMKLDGATPSNFISEDQPVLAQIPVYHFTTAAKQTLLPKHPTATRALSKNSTQLNLRFVWEDGTPVSFESSSGFDITLQLELTITTLASKRK